MRPLHILQVTPYFEEAWAYGGIPRVASALCTGLARRGHHVTVCTTDARDRTSRLARPARGSAERAVHTTDDGVVVRVFPNLSNRLAYHHQLFIPLGLSSYLRTAAASFDIGHVHGCRHLLGATAARHLARAGVPYVITPHGTARLAERRFLAKRVFDRTVGRRTLADASQVLAVSDVERSSLEALGIDAGRIATVHNPLHPDELSASLDAGAFRRRLGINGRPMVLFLGRLSRQKRLDVLVRAFATLSQAHALLVIAGNDAGYGRELEALAAQLGVSSRTRVVGLLEGHARLEALSDADVLVYASEGEAFGMVPLEGLMCGTPVIVSNDAGCAELVTDTRGGRVVPAGDTAALAAAIADVLSSPERWRQAVAAAKGRVSATYGSDAVCRRLEELYSHLANGRVN